MKHYDAVVIGGGIIGMAVARAAAQAGLQVALVERDDLGCGASRAAAGMLAPTFEADFGAAAHELLALGRASAAQWPEYAQGLERETGLEVGLLRTGTLSIARDRDEAEGLERERELCEALGLPVARLLPSRARQLEPGLAPTVRLALQAPEDHSVDPRRVCAALARALEQLGVDLHLRRAFTGPRRIGGRVAGVTLEGGEQLACEQAVVCAGAWSGTLELAAETAIPVRPVKGQYLRLRDPSGPGLLSHVMRFEGGYIVPRGDGRYVLGATMEERGYDVTATAGGALELLREARELLPGIDELVIEEIGAGLRPATPDNLPVIGRARLGGLLWATGHFRNGVLLAPLTARLVLALLLGQPGEGVDARFLESCRADRFESMQAGRALEAAAL